MSEWIDVEIGKYCKLQGGFAFKSKDFVESGIPIVKIKNIQNRNATLEGSQCYPKEYSLKKLEKFKLYHGDVLIAMTGAGSVGRVGRLICDSESFGLMNQRVGRFDVDRDYLDREFLYYCLTHPKYQEALFMAGSGSGQPNLSPSQIESFRIGLPPLPEQKAIAHTLGTLDDKIELNRKMNQTLEAMAQALFKSWFVDFDPVMDNALAAGNDIPDELQAMAEKRRVIASGARQSHRLIDTNPELTAQFPSAFVFNETLGKWIPEGWEVKKLQELVNVKYGKDHKKLEEGDIPCFGSGGIMRYVGKALFENESVLIPRKGTLDNVIYVNKPFWSVDTMFYTEINQKDFVKYFFYVVNKMNFSEMNEGSAVPSMTTAQLNGMDILFPSSIILSEFEALISKYFSKKESNDLQTETLTQLRDRLLPELISGRVKMKELDEWKEQKLAMVAEKRAIYTSKS